MRIFNFFLIAILILFPVFLEAQSICGIMAGYNKPQYFDNANTPHYSGSYNSPASYYLGAFLKPRNYKQFNVGIEVSFVNRKMDVIAAYGGLGGLDYQKSHFNLNYLYFSIIPEFSIRKKIIYSFSVGPQLGFLVNSHSTGTLNSDNSSSSPNSIEDGKATEFNSSELRIYANSNITIPVNNRIEIIINASFSRGLTSAAKGNYGAYSNFNSSNDLTLTTGFVYKLDKLTFSLFPKPKKHEKKS